MDRNTGDERDITVRGNGVERTLKASVFYWLFGDWFIDYAGYANNNLINVRTGEVRHFGDFSADREADGLIVYGSSPVGKDYRDRLVGVMNLDGDIVVESVYDSLEAIGDWFLARQGIYGGLIDRDGRWLIKTPLFGNSG